MADQDVQLVTPMGPVRATVRPPGSKSITNRALLCAALAVGPSRLLHALDSDDTRVLYDALRTLGIGLTWDRAGCEMTVGGGGGSWPCRAADLDVANSGTSMRFLAALLATGHGRYRLDGTPRMRQRPIGDLLVALRQLGATLHSERENDCPPVVIEAAGLRGGVARVRGDISSQFLSGLLLAAPCARRPVSLVVEGPLVSQPYVRMTLGVMRAFGVEVPDSALAAFEIAAPRRYRGCQYPIEPDASAASYFWAAAAVTGGQVTVSGLGPHSLQGDIAFCDCLERMGCRVLREAERMTVAGGPLRGIEVDMNAISDTVQSLAAVALFADGPTTITGVAHIRHKETDRIGDLARELRRLGATVVELPDGLRITPAPLHGARLATYDDHRMAMSLAVVGLRVPGVAIENPGCTAKTYPQFFRDLESLRTSR
ncbi:MAG: 3-phosphoshikimate 1-carboxyvinyltransferase [Pirellulaceae bacterium]|jgi:3-phosphoshikimate 1-carboxyvinyltransferase|nr:3-phosphoshikimate 1-carboxyvinyltransferase [Pirellulaceae bacterium]